MRLAVETISKVEGVRMDANSLVEDSFLLAYAFTEEEDFLAACANTCRALEQLVSGKVVPGDLKYDFEEWKAYHYQHRVAQGMKADCRIMYRKIPDGIEVKGFGHRHIPYDFYERMKRHE